MTNSLYSQFLVDKNLNKKRFSVLIDPDDIQTKNLEKLVNISTEAAIDYFFVGGSLVLKDNMDECLNIIKDNCDIPVVLFPGNSYQVNEKADAIFCRNPDLLIGQHVSAAPVIKRSGLEVIPTGYIVVDGGAPTTVSYMSGSHPIPADKNNVAACTAMAGEMLGLKVMYMDAGSGAKNPITETMISEVNKNVSVPIIVGGGISDPEKAYSNCKSGADIIVIGNAIEKDQSLISEVAHAIHSIESV